MTYYTDISQFLKTRLTTGIQRVIKEFLQRAITDTYKLNVIYYDTTLKCYQLLDNTELNHFLKDIKNYQFKNKQNINLYQQTQKTKIFIEIDTVWNSELKRDTLYKKLKNHNYKIVNFIYDLIPLIHPNYLYTQTQQNFPTFLDAVFTHSDQVFFNSTSSKTDFLNLKKERKIKRDMKTDILPLGADFTSTKPNQIIKQNQNTKPTQSHQTLLTKPYLLFVGTLEPRKQQPQVLKAFETLQKTYPNLNLIFIGRVGWNVEPFIKTLQTHPLINKNLHHLQNIDDHTLTMFYKNAFIVTYISDYEGYGLPIVESLSYANITITSKNSSMYEVGQDFADYILKNTQDELISMVSSYIQNPKTYKSKKEYIKNHYKTPSWDDFYKKLQTKLKNKSKK